MLREIWQELLRVMPTLEYKNNPNVNSYYCRPNENTKFNVL